MHACTVPWGAGEGEGDAALIEEEIDYHQHRKIEDRSKKDLICSFSKSIDIGTIK